MASNAATGPSDRSLQHLVLDAGALIRISDLSTDLADFVRTANSVVTIPDVIAEIRDEKSRRALMNSFPFGKKLEVREPSKIAIHHIVEFAKSTGDLRSLSKPDIRLMALTYMLHAEVHGAETTTQVTKSDGTVLVDDAKATLVSEKKKNAPKAALVKPGVSWASLASSSVKKVEPPKERIDGFRPSSHFKGAAPGFYFGTGEHGVGYYRDSAQNASPFAVQAVAETEDCSSGTQSAWPSLPSNLDRESATSEPTPQMLEAARRREENKLAKENAAEAAKQAREEEMARIAKASEHVDDANARNPLQSRIFGMASGGEQAKDLEEEDDGIGWADMNTLSLVPGTEESASAGWGVITHQKHKNKTDDKHQLRKDDTLVACVTTDYTMQNVMLQMRLRVLGLSGRNVSTVKRWVLKCDACFQMCSDMSKVFCPSCGSNTLARLAYSIDENGKRSYHYKKNRRINVRGTKYSMAHPSSNRSKRNSDRKKKTTGILLREDQMLSGMWAQKSRKKESATSMFGEHVAESFGLSLTRSKGVQVGYGRRNKNAMKGRERRGKKKA